MGMFNCGLEPEDRAPYDKKSENINMDTSDLESKLELGKRRAEELGLKTDMGVWYPAYDIHRLLSEGVEMSTDLNDHDSLWSSPKHFSDTYQALLIGIKPIVQESAEELLDLILRNPNIELPKIREQIAKYMNTIGYKRLLERTGE